MLLCMENQDAAAFLPFFRSFLILTSTFSDFHDVGRGVARRLFRAGAQRCRSAGFPKARHGVDAKCVMSVPSEKLRA